MLRSPVGFELKKTEEERKARKPTLSNQLLEARFLMEVANKPGYKPPPEFQEDARDPLVELNTTDSTEFWLIQWPKDQAPDFDGQQLSLDLHHDGGQLGTFVGSSGKSYDVVSLAAKEPNATVFLSSAAESKFVGKITRRVSLVHYLDPNEVPNDDMRKLKELHERSLAPSVTNSGYRLAAPTRTIRSSGRTSTHGSGRRSSLSKERGESKDSIGLHINEPNTTWNLEQSHETVAHVESSQHSQEKKAKRRKKHED